MQRAKDEKWMTEKVNFVEWGSKTHRCVAPFLFNQLSIFFVYFPSPFICFPMLISSILWQKNRFCLFKTNISLWQSLFCCDQQFCYCSSIHSRQLAKTWIMKNKIMLKADSFLSFSFVFWYFFCFFAKYKLPTKIGE